MINTEDIDEIIDISDSSNDATPLSTITIINKSVILNSMVNKEPVVTCDGVITELIKHAHVKNSVDKQPVVLVDDTLSRFLSRGTNEKTFIEHDHSLAEIIKMNVKYDNKNATSQETDFKNSDFEIATIKKIQVDKYENVAKVKPFHLQDENSDITTENTRNRLIFEDDEDDEEDEEDLINLGNLRNNAGARETDVYQGMSLLGTRAAETNTPSVHYEDLIEDKMYVCQRCGLISSNR